jgi:hypothetical protein
MSKEKRRNINDEIRIHRGVIPWSAQEYNYVMQAFMARRKDFKPKYPLTEDFAFAEDEIADLSPGQLYNLISMMLVSDIFHERYPNELEYNAHFVRFHEIKKFLNEHNRELFKLGFTAGPEDIMNVKPQLLETLCTVMYDQEVRDESGEFTGCTFLFPQVVTITQAKMNAHAN